MTELSARLANLSPAKRALLQQRLQEQSGQGRRSTIPCRNAPAAPLSFAQQRLWFLSQLEPELPIYTVAHTAELTGNLRIDLVQRVLDTIVQRHTLLHSRVDDSTGEPVLHTLSPQPVPLTVVDLRQESIADRDQSVQRLIQQAIQQPFDLSQGSMLRAVVIQLDPTRALLLLTNHHIISDDWSIAVFWREFATLYSAFSTGQASPLTDLPIQYGDFAHWQRQWLQGETLQSQLEYWTQQLGGELPDLELPLDRPRPAVQTFNGAQLELVLDSALTEQLKLLSRQEGATLFMTLLAAFNLLLHRYTGQDDVVVGSPIANRNQIETEGLIGLFANMLVLRTDLSGNPTARSLIGRVRERAIAAYAHQDLPFEKLVAALQPNRDRSRSPLFQVVFALQTQPSLSFTLPELTLTPSDVDTGIAHFDLSIDLFEGEEIQGWVNYNTDLFDAATIQRLIGHYQTLLAAIVAHPDQPISTLPILTSAERQQLLVQWNQTQVSFPDASLHQLFEAQVDRTPDAIAVIFADEALTYRELNQKANQLAGHLRSLGVEPDSLVGICLERSIHLIVSILAVLKAGGAYVPLDPAYPTDRLAFLLTDTQISVVLLQSHLRDRLPPSLSHPVRLDTDWDQIAPYNTSNLANQTTPDNLAYVFYTSGSTGQPKGVLNTHRGVCNLLFWTLEAYPLSQADRVLQKTPFSFDVSVWEIFWPLSAGACLVMTRPEGHKDPAYLVELISQQQITMVNFVPSMLQVFLEEPNLESCRCLKRMICGGEALSVTLQERFFTRMQAELHNLYGPTEAAIGISFWHCQPESGLRSVPIGRPIANTQIYLLDSDLNPVPIGVAGELHIGGASLARGYLNHPELTQERFIPDPFSSNPAARLYKTGDLARYRRDGAIEYLGRIDHQVKIRGLRIELGEIESALRQHPSVQDSVVTLHLDQTNPSETQRLVAYVTSSQGQPPTVEELLHGLEQTLPEYMVPSAVVLLDAMPLNANGKVDRRALPAPSRFNMRREAVYLAPRTPVEQQLEHLWSELLGLEQISIHDNFFQLGGHSLLATRVLSRIRDIFQVQIPLRVLFETPTIADLALAITQQQAETADATEMAFLLAELENGD